MTALLSARRRGAVILRAQTRAVILRAQTRAVILRAQTRVEDLSCVQLMLIRVNRVA
jgi:hypothetical protein